MDDILKKNEQNSFSDENIDPTQHVTETHNTNFETNEIPPEDLDSRWLRWKCLVCGYLYEGVIRIKICPKCGNEDPDKFEDAE